MWTLHKDDLIRRSWTMLCVQRNSSAWLLTLRYCKLGRNIIWLILSCYFLFHIFPLSLPLKDLPEKISSWNKSSRILTILIIILLQNQCAMNKFYCSSKIFMDGSKNKAPSAHLAVFLRVPIKKKKSKACKCWTRNHFSKMKFGR